MDSLKRKKRCANITNEQRTLLIEFMNKHNELLKGKFTSSFTMKDSVRLWNEITKILNSVNGAKKDWKGWRKCWHDFQSRSKKKHTVIKQSMAATGGGTQNTETLTSQEQQVLNIMCSTSIHGHPDVGESSINILEDSEDEVMDVEYLNEDEEDVASQIVISTSSSDSNNCNKLVTRETKAVVDNSSKKLSHEKENINKIQTNDTDVKQLSSKVGKIFQDIEMSTNAKSYEQDKTSNQKKTVNTVKKKLRNTVEVSTNLNNVYEKTYEMKKDYYKARLEHLQRSVEAKERIANSAERCNTC
ncbi:uncharacterized protein [Temnothorax longispinosus]|uniref:uncharacterized protein n=1 Tax=Temnothorax longispinosus TaxID=300112 RepID=UPI003A9A5BCD